MASRSNKMARYAPQTMTQVSSAPKTPPSLMGSLSGAVSARGPRAVSATLRTKPKPRAVSATGVDRNGNRTGPRPQVGPADPATRRRMLDAALQPGPPVKKPLPVSGMKPQAAFGAGTGIGGQKRADAIDDQAARFQR